MIAPSEVQGVLSGPNPWNYVPAAADLGSGYAMHPAAVSGPVGAAVSVTVSALVDLYQAVTITPTDGAGGTFSPSSVSLNATVRSATVTYTPSTAGARTLTATNTSALADPSGVTYTAAAGNATSYTLTGPSSGTVGMASGNFTVAPNSLYTGTITPDDAGAGGVFTPSSLRWSSSAAPQTFTYTPAKTGSITIGTTSSPALTAPAGVQFTASLAGATSYTLSGPGSGTVGAASTNFTVTPVGGIYTGTITPHSTGAGTFSPSSLIFSQSSAPQTFTYTPGSTVGSPHSISTLASPALGTDPAPIAYTVNPAAATSYTLTGPSNGFVGVASSNFTVTPNGVFTGTITPSDGGAGGTFSPTALSWSGTWGANVFTYTPRSTGTLSISCTNNKGLINPQAVTY